MTTAQDTVTAAAAYLDSVASGAASSSNYFAQVAAGAAQTAAALRAIVLNAPLPTVTLAGPGDIAPSTTTEIDASAAIAVSTPTDHPVAADWALTGNVADDFLGDTSGHVTIPTGQSSAPIPLRVAPLRLTADRAPVSLALANFTGAAQPFPAPVAFTLRANTQAKGTLAFGASIGTVVRDPVAETTVMMEVTREGVSTQAAASLPAPDVTGIDGLLKAVGPADFLAGQRVGHAPMVLHPYGASAAAAKTKPKRTTGRAALVATAGFDLGANATQDFVVQDGQDVQTGTNPFQLKGVDLGPLPFLFGMSMGHDAASAAVWLREIGRPPLCCSGGSHSAGRTATWQGVRGGDKGAIGKGTQLDIAGHSTNLSDAFDIIKPGPGLIIATWRTVPDNIGASDYAGLANGAHDNDAYTMGWNAWLLVKSYGLRGGQLVVRGDKEYNGGGYAITAANAAQRAAWLARYIGNFNKGYADAGADDRPRHVLGLARHDQLGPLEAHVPVGPNGQVMVDAIDISMHPPGQLNQLSGKPLDVQVAGVRAWIRGDYENGRTCYAPDHSDPKYSGLVVAKAHGILISNFETSPRDDGNLACEISAAAWQGLFDFWTEQAAMVGGVGVYNHTCLERGLAVKGWADGVNALVRLARGG